MNSMTVRRYLKWDYDAQAVTEYRRHGQCNNCGQCCRAHIQYELAGPHATEDRRSAQVGTGTSESGVWHEVSEGEHRWMIGNAIVSQQGKHQCPLLDGDTLLCTKHEEKDPESNELALCALWPMGPEHVESFDECSYEFEEIASWRMQD